MIDPQGYRVPTLGDRDRREAATPVTRKSNFPVLLLYDVDPSWTVEERAECLREANRMVEGLRGEGYPAEALALTGPDLVLVLAGLDPSSVIVFHGCDGLPGVPRGEVRVARTLEHRGFTFTGASSVALRLAYDKPRIKVILERAGIPTPAWQVYDKPEACDWDRFPAIVKPVHEHASVGLTPESVVLNREEMEVRIRFVLETLLQPALVEDFIDGREFHVGVWGNRHLEVLPPVEMDFSAFPDIHDRLCTWDAKFDPTSVHYQRTASLIPAPLSDAEGDALRQVAVAAYRAAGCRDYARMDIRLRDGVFHVLDVNPNADLSADASFACAAEVLGYTYGRMVSRIVGLAALRHPDRARFAVEAGG